ncbi:MAG: RNA polymerase sigma-70 factor [Phaeodactylibacter sp.]|nr:RNA polymerase sigma-70 factor [Phaeodactylibacter sp.]MCB9301554.1 RNA polymerase sigma-70 factor [Lewinellaceae bacterium]HQU57661.1 RNA polymerase sigma-70 factor [Saprospiraceae bacterium]
MENRPSERQLQQLFQRFQPMLVAYACQYLRSEEDAREAVQDVFMGVWNNREHLQLDESLKPYLYTATRNKALNYLNRRRLAAVSIEEAPVYASERPKVEAAMEAEELKALIYDEVRRLPERCREIFLLSRREGLSNREIAERLAVSEKTVENQMTIALKRLRARVYGAEGQSGSLASFVLLVFLLIFVKKILLSLWGLSI